MTASKQNETFGIARVKIIHKQTKKGGFKHAARGGGGGGADVVQAGSVMLGKTECRNKGKFRDNFTRVQGAGTTRTTWYH
jgi:NAD(P)H-dependent flavin oxidoreductase YrpB (nitropropane dioxygenase family)